MSNMRKQYCLEAKNIHKSFDRKKNDLVLKGVSIQVRKGETLALVGESGCGKTTLGKILIGLHPADAGEILYEGRPVCPRTARNSTGEGPNIQMVFQNPHGSLNPRMKIYDLLKEAHDSNRHNPRFDRAIAGQALTLVGLREGDLAKYPHEFSGGQQQRICIARAVVTRPDFIICDEPTSALDLLVQAQILNVFQRLQKEYQFGFVFISHDLSAVRFISDRVAVMSEGRIVEEGPTKDVFSAPIHPYTRLLLNSSPRVEGLSEDDTPLSLEELIELEQESRRLAELEKSVYREVGENHWVLLA